MAAAAGHHHRHPRCRSYQSSPPAAPIQKYLNEQKILQEGHPAGTPQWKGEVVPKEDGSHQNIKFESPLVQDPRWYSPPLRELGESGWRSTDSTHGDAQPVGMYPPTIHKAVVLADPLRHPHPRPVSPLVLVRLLNDKSVGFGPRAEDSLGTEVHRMPRRSARNENASLLKPLRWNAGH